MRVVANSGLKKPDAIFVSKGGEKNRRRDKRKSQYSSSMDVIDISYWSKLSDNNLRGHSRATTWFIHRQTLVGGGKGLVHKKPRFSNNWKRDRDSALSSDDCHHEGQKKNDAGESVSFEKRPCKAMIYSNNDSPPPIHHGSFKERAAKVVGKGSSLPTI